MWPFRYSSLYIYTATDLSGSVRMQKKGWSLTNMPENSLPFESIAFPLPWAYPSSLSSPVYSQLDHVITIFFVPFCSLFWAFMSLR